MGQKYTVEDEPDLTIPEDTILRARLNEVKPRTMEWKDKVTGEPKSQQMLQFIFEVVSDNQYRGKLVRGEVQAKISNHPGNKFRQWTESLLGRELPVGMAIDVDDIVGLTADITVKHRLSKDKDRTFEEIDDVIPVTGNFELQPPPF